VGVAGGHELTPRPPPPPPPPPRRTGLGAATDNAGNAGNAGDLMSMPDDTFAMVLAAIDQPQAAACMLATCQRVRAALRVPVPVCTVGPSALMIVQVEAVSAALCLRGAGPYPGQQRFHRPKLELASARGWVHLLPLLVSRKERWFLGKFAAKGGHLALLQWASAQSPSTCMGETCNHAAKGGHLAMLQWARAQSPPAL